MVYIDVIVLDCRVRCLGVACWICCGQFSYGEGHYFTGDEVKANVQSLQSLKLFGQAQRASVILDLPFVIRAGLARIVGAGSVIESLIVRFAS